MMINFNEAIFQSNLKSLHDISYDSANNVHMTSSVRNAVEFDTVKALYLGNTSLKSCDALLSHLCGHTLIEFKNGYIGSSTNLEIRIKIADSLLIISDIKKVNIVPVAKNEIEFILVYNDTKLTPSQQTIQQHIAARANQEIIHFGLERYKGVYFKDVHTYTDTELVNYLNNHT